MLQKLVQHVTRRLRPGPPRHYRGPEVAAILPRLGELTAHSLNLNADRVQAVLEETYLHPTRPTPHRRLTAEADALLAGQFRPASRWEPQPLGFPPPWSADPFDDDNWVSALHGLEWLIPLVHSHAGDPEKGYLDKAKLAIEDWILSNPFRRAPSRFSWHDHAAAKRLRLFTWFWEQYRESDEFDPEFARLLLASVYQHALYHLDERNYRPDSNHGLEAIGALRAAGIAFPFFRDARSWETKAAERLRQWLADNLSPEGFHMEQSPSYHWFVLLRMAAIDRFLRANGRDEPVLTEAAERAAAVWPHLLRPDGQIPPIGDSGTEVPRDWRGLLERRWGRPVPKPTEATGPLVSTERKGLVVSPRAGYAVFRSAGLSDEESRQDIHIVFRCRAFVSPHCHYDALSFVFYGLGRDWLVDSGYLNYHEWDPRRQYLRSPRAHTLVVIGDHDFRTQQNDLADWGRTEDGDYAVAYHDLPRGRHARRLLLTRSGEILLRDEVQHTGRRWLPWAQLFQIAPDLEVVLVSDREVRLKAQDGSGCVILQDVRGQWRVVRGQERPRLQGWYSPAYGKWEPSTTLFFYPPMGVTRVESRLTLQQSGSST